MTLAMVRLHKFHNSSLSLIDLDYFLEHLKTLKMETNGFNGVKPVAAVKVNDLIGSALPRIGPYKKLDNKKQVVALIDDVSLLNQNLG